MIIGEVKRYLRDNNSIRVSRSVREIAYKALAIQEKYKMIGKSVTDLSWLDEIDLDNQSVLIVAEGLTMYLSEQELQQLIKGINSNLPKRLSVMTVFFVRQAVIQIN